MSFALPERIEDKPRVLLAEDDDDLRQLLTQRLEEHGAEVVACAHGLQLVDELERRRTATTREPVDLVITDIRMPGVTGMEILAGLEALCDRCPVILMTAFGDNETHAAAKRLRASAVFDKPFDVDRLIECIDQILGNREPPGSEATQLSR